MPLLYPYAQKILETLQPVATITFDCQRRLGLDAIIWRDGKVIEIDEDALADLAATKDSEMDKAELGFVAN